MKNMKQFATVLKKIFLIAKCIYSINEHLNYKQEIKIHDNYVRKVL